MNSTTIRLYVRALKQVKPYWPYLALLLLVSLLGAPIALLMPLPVKIIIDSVLGLEPLPWFIDGALPTVFKTSPEKIFGVAVALSVLVGLASVGRSVADWLLREGLAERIVRDFRSQVFLASMQVPFLRQQDQGSYDPAYRIQHDAPALQWTTIYGIMPLIMFISSASSMLYVTASISPKLALITLATSLPVILLTHFSEMHFRSLWHRVMQLDSEAQSVVYEVLGALSVVTIFRRERRELQRFLDRSGAGLHTRLRVMRLQGGFEAVWGLGPALGTTLVLYFGVRDVQAQLLSVGELLLIIGYIAQLYAPLHSIGRHVTSQQQAVASLERGFAVLDQKPAVTERDHAIPVQRVTGRVCFRQVSFAYQSGRPVLSGASFEVPAGSCVGIIGKTGAGKTTLVNLLIRLFDPTEGQILLDGIDLRDYRLDDLRNQFTVVFQDPVLFSTTIAENIAYSVPEASIDAIIEAAKHAGVHDLISALPQGYETQVGERGTLMSGGERQRISLARAFLRDAPILILDEPTSSIDLETEMEILGGLERLMQGRTTFVIAHRLTTLRHANMILRVRNGEVMTERRDDFDIGVRSFLRELEAPATVGRR